MNVTRVAGTTFGMLAAVLAAVAIGCGDGTGRTPKPPTSETTQTALFEPPTEPEPRPNDYVGSAACVECHAGVCDEFAAHPMANSLAAIDEGLIAEMPAGEAVAVRPAPRSSLRTTYRVETEGGAMVHREIVELPGGDVVTDLSMPVHYAVGSGSQGRSFFTERDGVLTMSPLTWYADREEWDLSPGYEVANLGFSRRVTSLCVQCHSGRPVPDPEQPDRYVAPVFREAAIGCEQCHGPGGRHAEFHAGAEDAPSEDPMARLASLSDWQLNQVCFQCHLNDDLRLTKYGRSHGDFRPGDDLSDVWVTFVEESREQAERSELAVGQVQQMMGSVCYEKSGGAMTCVSCHDPHTAVSGAAAIDHYRAACVSCHEDAAGEVVCDEPVENRLEVTAEDSCVVCHMPKRGSADVVHVSHTDHRIPRRAEDAESDTDKGKQNRPRQELAVFGGNPDAYSEAELGRASALAMVRRAERTGYVNDVADAIPILEEWVKVAPEDSEAQVALAMALSMVGEEAAAVRSLEAAVEQDPDHEYYLRQLLVLLHGLRAPELAAKYGRRLVEVNPHDYEYQGRLSHVLGRTGDVPRAIEAAEAAIALNPGVVQLHEWLADLYEANDPPDPEAAARHREIAEKLSR